MTLNYEYRTWADHVLPPAVPAHLANIDCLRRETGFLLTSPYEQLWWRDINWSVVLLAVVTVFLSSAGARKVYRYDPGSAVTASSGTAPCGIRGWLLAVAVFVTVHPIFRILDIWCRGESYGKGQWTYLTSPGSTGYHALREPVLLFQAVFYLSWSVFAVLMTVLFLRKRRTFPSLFVLYLVITLALASAVALVNWTMGLLEGEDMICEAVALFGYAIVVLSCCLYNLFSRRVRNTFVRGLPAGFIEHGKSVADGSESPPYCSDVCGKIRHPECREFVKGTNSN